MERWVVHGKPSSASLPLPLFCWLYTRRSAHVLPRVRILALVSRGVAFASFRTRLRS